MPLPLRILNLAAVAIAIAVVDWSLKVWAQIDLPPEDIVLNTDRQWQAIPVCIVLGIGLIAVSRTPLLAFGAGVVTGAALGNLGEQAVLGHVTDFIPVGFPAEGSTWSPADFFLIAGLLLLWAGAAQYSRSRALQARDPLHGRRRRSRREGNEVLGDPGRG